MSRGPDTPLPLPPADLGTRLLPAHRLDAPVVLFRIHLAEYQPLFFSPPSGNRPRGRFDSLSGRFRALYAATTLAGAVVETLLRNPTEPLVTLSRLAPRALAIVRIGRPLKLVDLTGPGLSQLGLDARLLSGPYDLCGAWADSFHGHPSLADGILYPSRFDPSARCVALFDRVLPALPRPAESTPLLAMAEEIAAVLDRYGKALEPE